MKKALTVNGKTGSRGIQRCSAYLAHRLEQSQVTIAPRHESDVAQYLDGNHNEAAPDLLVLLLMLAFDENLDREERGR